MKRSKFTEQQIVFALKHAETGVPVAEIYRKVASRKRRFSTRSGSSPNSARQS